MVTPSPTSTRSRGRPSRVRSWCCLRSVRTYARPSPPRARRPGRRCHSPTWTRSCSRSRPLPVVLSVNEDPDPLVFLLPHALRHRVPAFIGPDAVALPGPAHAPALDLLPAVIAGSPGCRRLAPPPFSPRSPSALPPPRAAISRGRGSPARPPVSVWRGVAWRGGAGRGSAGGRGGARGAARCGAGRPQATPQWSGHAPMGPGTPPWGWPTSRSLRTGARSRPGPVTAPPPGVPVRTVVRRYGRRDAR